MDGDAHFHFGHEMLDGPLFRPLSILCGSGRNIVELADENDTHIFNSHGYFCAFINCRWMVIIEIDWLDFGAWWQKLMSKDDNSPYEEVELKAQR